MKKLLLFGFILTLNLALFGQNFEESKIESFNDKVKVSIGADFALQYQSLDLVGKMADGTEFMPIGSGINLPTANFSIYGDLAPGIRVTLETYLSSRHHNEAWVKGGYLLFDRLPFLKSGTADKIMEYLTLKVGVMEVNYGDGHFRRSDNGRVIVNAFVGNYIMDAFTTAPSVELMFRHNGWLAMGAITSGNLKPELVGWSNNSYTTYNLMKELAFYGKFGYDKQIDEKLRVRLTVSPYLQDYNHRGTLYSGDRAGERFYSVLVPVTAGKDGTDIKLNATNGRWGPGGFTKDNSLMANLFVKYSGFELFGLFENAKGENSNGDFNFNQYAVEALYRFGKTEQFYFGGKYNKVKNDNDENVKRVEIAGGWFLTKNIVTKLEYVNQKYQTTSYSDGAGFKGMMLEAAISF